MKAKNYLLVAALVAAMTNPSWAKDAIEASVTNWTGTPIIQNNGNPDAQGTYAVGTIQLTYTVVGYTFPVGLLGSFDLNWGVAPGYSSGPAPAYPINLKVEQIGGTNLTLLPTPDNFTVTSNSDSGMSRVDMAIASSVPTDPALNCDGCTLTGNLRMTTSPAGAKLDTVTNVQVKVMLLHPTNCLKAFNFVTDQDYERGVLTSTTVKVGTSGPWNGKVKGSDPSQYADNVLIANTCANDESFDLKIELDPSFETNPSNNPGNAVFTYSTTGEMDQTSFNLSSFGTGTAKGQQLCLQNVTVPAGSSFLTTVHSQLIKGVLPSTLPGDKSFDFTAKLFETVNAGCTGGLKSAVNPNNPAIFTLPFAVSN